MRPVSVIARSLLLASILAPLALASTQEAEIEGRVVAVDPGTALADGGMAIETEVEIEIAGDLFPAIGDPVRFLQEVPGVGPVEMEGDWVVTDVGRETVAAVPEVAFVIPRPDAFEFPLDPSVGDAALIGSTRQRTAEQVLRELAFVEAAQSGDLAAVRAALSAGTHPDARGSLGMTALAAATLGGHEEIVAEILAAGADPAAEIRGQPMLSPIASSEETQYGLAIILDSGADPNVAGAHDFRPIHFATEEYAWLNVYQLVRAGADVDARLAATAPDTVVYLFQQEPIRFARGGATPLILAAINGDEETLAVLLAHGADPRAENTAGRTPVEILQTLDSCERCLEHFDGRRDASAELQEMLLDETRDAIEDHDDLQHLRLMLRLGVEPNALGDVGAPLHWLSEGSEGLPLADAIDLLLEAGAEIDLPNEYGASPLMVAASEGRAALVGLLLDRGASIDRWATLPEHPGAGGPTALMVAARAGHAEVVRDLLARGATVDLQTIGSDEGDDAGVTALMVAAGEGDEEIVRLLLAAGADPTLRDAEGDTAADYAERRSYLSLAELLR